MCYCFLFFMEIMYSQNDEQQRILDYFKEAKGTVLDLGANDGKTLSNSLKVIELGWNALLVEPSKEAFRRLEKLHKQNEKVVCINQAISYIEGELDFFESGSHISKDDFSLLSTLKPSEMSRWLGKADFNPITVDAITFKTLLNKSPYKKFDLITIDIEGLDYEVLTQINLREVECKMLIIETNSIEDNKYIHYCGKYDMRLIHKNHENLIFVR
jgi:FkbM family methyltransferase